MGFNSLLFINNDCMGSIDDDPKGWWKVARAALAKVISFEAVEFSFKGFVNYNKAVWCQHSNVRGLVVVGGNTAKVIATGYKDMDELELLKKAADDMGYKIIKKSRRDEKK